MTQGVCRPHHELEEEIRRTTGKERAISFASGLLANLGFVNGMTQAMDLGGDVEVNNRDTVLVLDRDVHWSLWKAVEGLEYGKRAFVFRHNDPQDLRRVLARLTAEKVVVVFESVYSADGSMAPVEQLLDICEQHGAVSFVDDANGYLVYGPEHRSWARESAAIRERADFVMVSLSKAVGLDGGVLAGPERAVRAFELLSGTSMYTAALQPPTAYTAARLIRLLDRDHGIVDDYLERVARFQRRLVDMGSPPVPTGTYITSVPVGDDEKANALRERFLERGYLVPMFSYPAVPRNKATMRLLLHANHSEEQIDAFLDTLTELTRALDH